MDVSIPTLMLSLVHMSGDPELIRGALRPAGLFLNEVQGFMSEDDRARAREAALPVIEVDNLEAAEEAVWAAGGEISLPIFAFPGGRRFHFRDPDGHELAVMQPAAEG